MNFANIQRQNSKNMIKSAKQVQETAAAYADRENKINGWQGTAAEILDRHTPKSCAASFGYSGSGTCVGP